MTNKLHMKPNIKTLEQVLFFLFLLSLPFNRRHEFGTYGFPGFQTAYLYLSDILLVATVAMGMFSRQTRSNLITIALFLLGIGVFFLSPRETYTWYWLIKVIELAILVTYCSFAPRGLKIRTLFLSGIVVSGVIQAVIEVGQFLMQQSIGLHILGENTLARGIAGVAKINFDGEKLIRAYGTFPHPNPLSAFMLVACGAAVVAYVQAESRREKSLMATSIALILLGIFLTFSRAGIVVSYVTLALFWVLMANRERLVFRRVREVIMVIGGATILLGILSYPYLSARITDNSPTPYTRSYYNHLGLQITDEHMFGVGPGRMLKAMEEKIKPQETWQVQPPHNYFIEVACETGFIGLILIIYIFLKVLSLGFRLDPNRPAETAYSTMLFSSFVGLIVLMFFDHYFYTVQQAQLLLWLVVGLIINQSKALKIQQE